MEKLRLLVMNGQRIVQTETDGEWVVLGVDRANGLPPGIYKLFNGSLADKLGRYRGMIVYIGQDYLFQKVGDDYILHACSDFKRTKPASGAVKVISYDKEGKAVIKGVPRRKSLG
jgi:hypothetical protein